MCQFIAHRVSCWWCQQSACGWRTGRTSGSGFELRGSASPAQPNATLKLVTSISKSWHWLQFIPTWNVSITKGSPHISHCFISPRERRRSRSISIGTNAPNGMIFLKLKGSLKYAFSCVLAFFFEMGLLKYLFM